MGALPCSRDFIALVNARPAAQKWLNDGCAKASRLPSRPRKRAVPFPAVTVADLGHRHARCRRLLAQRRDLAGRHGRKHLVVVTAGEDRLDQRGLLASAARAASDSGTRSTSISAANAGSAAELGEIAGQAVGDVHRRVRVCADQIGDGVARLRHEIARPEVILRPPIEAPSFAGRGVAPQQQPERGVADGAGHHDAVARPSSRRDAPSRRAARRRTRRSRSSSGRACARCRRRAAEQP